MRMGEWLQLRDAAWKLRMTPRTIRRAIKAQNLTSKTDAQGRIFVLAREVHYILNRRPGQPTLAELREREAE